VGVGNHNTFLAYITFQYGLLVLTSVGGVYSIIQRAQNHHQNDDFLPFLLSQYYWQVESKYFYPGAGSVVFFASLFMVPMTILVSV
jgi:hypothetical protein